jgi:spore maturation protein CgeB
VKILVSGFHNPLYPTIVEYIENAVKSIGHNLISFDDHQYIFPGRVRTLLPRLNRWDSNHVNRKLYNLVAKEKPDLVIITQGFLVLKETVNKIRNLGIPVILWVIDAPINFSNILDTGPYYDFIFCGGTEAIEIFEKLGYKNIEWLPFAYDSSMNFSYSTLETGKKIISEEVVFVGSHYPNRERIFESLVDRGHSMNIWGSGWDKVSLNSPLKKYIHKTHTTSEEWMQIYDGSKIILVIHYPSTNRIPVYQASPKIYEALACGGFVISDNQKDVRTLFKEGVHLAIFSNLDDLDNKISYYLDHEEIRQQIAAQGQLEVQTKHTYKVRIKKMLNTLNSSGILSIH